MVLSQRVLNGAKVTTRSSHTKVTPTAGGIVIVAATVAGTIANHAIMGYNDWLVLAGGLLLATVSFMDDLHPLPPLPRLIVQIVAVSASFWWLCYPEAAFLYVAVVFGGVAFVNGLNFLDGICGMLGMYSAVLIGSLWFAFTYLAPECPESQLYTNLCVWMLIGIAAFMAFNIRDVIFSGDTGSVFMGFVAGVILANLIISTRSMYFLVFVSVCFCDTGLTTFHRLLSGKNIFRPHKCFIYQRLVAYWHLPHLAVSMIYAVLQLVIDAVFFCIPDSYRTVYLVAVVLALSLAYAVLRYYSSESTRRAPAK